MSLIADAVSNIEYNENTNESSFILFLYVGNRRDKIVPPKTVCITGKNTHLPLEAYKKNRPKTIRTS